MLPGTEPPARRLDAHDSQAPAPHERAKGPDGVRACADAGDYGVRVPTEPLSGLQLYLPADNRLKVAHYVRVRGRTHDAADDVVRILNVRHPVPDRLVH